MAKNDECANAGLRFFEDCDDIVDRALRRCPFLVKTGFVEFGGSDEDRVACHLAGAKHQVARAHRFVFNVFIEIKLLVFLVHTEQVIRISGPINGV
jgi:hypothetical protein